MKDGKKFKAALVGGAAGVFLSDELINVNMDYESLKNYSAVLGSGAILVMNDDADIVDMLWSVIRFFRHESCGKCSPCTNGNELLFKLINDIRNGKGKEEDLNKLIQVSEVMVDTCFCALGQSLLMPIKSAIDNFKDDFLKRMN